MLKNEEKNINKVYLVLKFSLPFILYLIIDLIYFFNWHKFIALSIFNPSGDPLSYIWYLNWWPWAITRGLNPFITHYIWAPSGENLIFTNLFPTVAIIGGPITLIFGPIMTYNIFAMLALPLTAYSTFLLLRYITKDSLASFVGGYLFGFSSYELGQFLGHMNLYLTFLIPLILLSVIKRYHGVISRLLFIILLAICVALEVEISSEIAFTLTLFGFISIIIFYLFANKEIRHKIIKLGLDIVVAYFFAAVLLSPFIYYLINGFFNLAPKGSTSQFSADLLNYIIPTPVTRFGRTIFENIASRFTGNYSEEGAYLGIILIMVAIFSIKEQLKNWWGKAIAIIAVVLFVSSLGPYLHINGIITKIPLFWELFANLPIFHDVLPTRLTMYVFLIVSILIALWLSMSGISKKNRISRYIIVFFGLIMLLPNIKIWHWDTVKTPSFFKDRIVMKKYINKGDNILILPWGNLGMDDYYQLESGMYFKMPEGYITFPPKNFLKWPAVQMFFSNTLSLDYAYQISAFIGSHNVKAVILTADVNKIWYHVFNRMHWEKFQTGGVILYKVPELINRKYKNITYLQFNQKMLLSTFNNLYNSSIKFLNHDELLSNLYPKYLENHGYLSKSFGYRSGKANNWTKNGGWIGQWGCPSGKGKCFGIGIVGNINELKPIIAKYQSKATQIFFPYPKVYKAYKANTSKSSGQLLMIFMTNNINM